MKTSKKILSLILSLTFIFGVAPEISAASDIDYYNLRQHRTKHLQRIEK